ncbi:MAG: lipopolysaccharide assembly protein LapA domain-containing protein [Rhodanobacter sp.]|nr:lipopolysaccharide assembly protein LapA domain-containing protein [Rhodanobacter sp.]
MRKLSSGLPTMRLILIVLMIAVAALGALFGALNGDRVPIDFYFSRIDVPLGTALLAALLAGWLLGGLIAWIGQVPRLRRDLRAAHRELHAARTDAQTRGSA